MGWHVSDDAEFYRQAQVFQSWVGSHWWVMWSPGRRCYTAFYCGPAVIAPVDVSPASGRDFRTELRNAREYAARPSSRRRPRRAFPPRQAR